MYVEDLYRFNVEPDGHEFTKNNNKVAIMILSIVPVSQYVILVFFIFKYIIYLTEFKDAKSA